MGFLRKNQQQYPLDRTSKSLHGPYLMHIILSSSHPSRKPLNAHHVRSQGVTWAVASPTQRNWGGQEKNFSSTPFRLLENHFSIIFLVSFLEYLDKQLSQAAFFVMVAFMPVQESKFSTDKPNSPRTNPPPQRLFNGFREIGKPTSGKTGVEMSIPFHPVATPLDTGCQCHPLARVYQLFVIPRILSSIF